MEVQITYGPSNDLLEFSSRFGYPTPTVNMSTQSIRTPAGDYLSDQTTITLNGVVYTQRQADHDTHTLTSALTKSPGPDKNFDDAEYNDYTVEGLLGAASGLKSAVLSRNHGLLQIKTANNAFLSYGHASVDSISFSPSSNNWNQTVDYEIVFNQYSYNTGSYLINKYNHNTDQPQAENTGEYITSVTDSYKLELMDDLYGFGGDYIPTYKLTRTLGAVGRVIQMGSGAVYHARNWVAQREKVAPLTGMFRPENFILYDQERSIDVDESAGSYTITDNFIAKSGVPYIHTSEVEVSTDEMENHTFTVKGSIKGLVPATGVYGFPVKDPSTGAPKYPGIQNQIYPTVPTRYDPTTGRISTDGSAAGSLATEHPKETFDAEIPMTAYHNAVIGYQSADSSIFGQALYYNKLANDFLLPDSRTPEYANRRDQRVNPIPLSITEAGFPYEGKIDYTRQYDCRDVPILTGALTESFKVSQNFPTVRNKEIKILGRRLGPLVYEYYNSLRPGSLTVTYEGVFPRRQGLKQYSFPQGLLNDLNDFLFLYRPPGTSYLTEDKETLNIHENKVTRVLTWSYNIKVD